MITSGSRGLALRGLPVGLALFLLAGACSDASSSPGNPGDGNSTPSSAQRLACESRGADGTDSDCVALGLPRKLDCTSEADMSAALARGCKREDPTDTNDYDVCCATDVQGTPTTSTPVSDAATPPRDGGTTGVDAAKPGLAIGERCTTESQCRSGVCYRPKGTTGFCTTSCSTSFDAACAGAKDNGAHTTAGEYLVCMPFAGGGRCYPGCVQGKQAACTPFGMTCRTSQKDIKNYNVSVCLEL